MRNGCAAWLLASYAVAGVMSAAQADEATARFDPSTYSQVPTACDVLASHPDDPNRVAPGRERSEMLGFLDAAAKQVAGDYYRTMLVELVRESVNAGRATRQ